MNGSIIFQRLRDQVRPELVAGDDRLRPELIVLNGRSAQRHHQVKLRTVVRTLTDQRYLK